MSGGYVNSYSPYGGPRRKARRKVFRRLFLLVLVALPVYAWWLSRDTYAIFRFVPVDAKYRVLVNEPVEKRDALFTSSSGRFLAERLVPEAVCTTLSEAEMPYPKWMLNHMFGDMSIISGRRLEDFSDFTLVCKMTRIGVLLERYFKHTGSVQRDDAGGLDLRYLPDSGLFYAVRGRVLILTPSRDALVRALTLKPEESMTRETFKTFVSEVVPGETLRGRVHFGKETPLAGVIQTLGFALRSDAGSTKIAWRCSLTDEWREQLAPILDGITKGPLYEDDQAILQVSAHFGVPVEDVWKSLEPTGWAPWLTAGQWDAWRSDSEAAGLPQFLCQLIGPMDQSVRIGCLGFALDEIFPMPRCYAQCTAEASQVSRIVGALPHQSVEPDSQAPIIRFDDELGYIYVPLAGGAEIQPTAYANDDGLILATGSPVMDQILSTPPQVVPVERDGNLFIKIDPHAAVEAVHEAGRLFAEYELLEGYTVASFDAACDAWRTEMQPIRQLSLETSAEHGELLGTLDIQFNTKQ